MAIRIQLRRDTAANWISSNPTLRAGEIGIETDTLKFKIGNGSSTWTQIIDYANITPSGLTNSLGDYILLADQGNPGGPAELDSNGDLIIPENSVILWNDVAYDYTTTITATQPTENRTITIPDSTGTIALTSDLTPYAPLAGATFTGNIQVPTAITFEGATADSYETVVQVTDPTDDRTITIPDVTGTIVTTGDTGTVTNTMLAGSIANNKLSNSAITINGVSTSLGGTRTLGTDDVSEGSINKYYTDERAQDAIATAIAAGTHTNITITYDDENNKFSFTGAQTYSDEMAQDAIGNNLGTGLSYNDETGAISVNTSVIQAKVTNVSDTEIGYLDGVTSAIQTQIDSKLASATAATTYAPINNPTFTGTVTLAADPSTDLQAATKAYVDSKTNGLTWKASVNLLATSNVALTGSTGSLIIDGHAALTATHNGYRLLLKAQSTGSENGIYVYNDAGSGYTLSRSTDADVYTELIGASVYVLEGTTYGSTTWVQSNHYLTSFSNQSWSQTSGAGAYTAGNGLSRSGTQFSIDTLITADLSSSQILTNKTISGSSNTLSNIGNSSLTNSKVTIGSTDINLGASSATLAGLTSVTSTSFVGALTGNADTVTNGVYTTGSYSDPSWLTISKSKVGLSNVENTALSTWAGTSNITTLGTVTTGTWSATTIAIAKGGTGATDASTARTNLGVAIGTDVQAYNSTLAAVAGGTYTGATSITTLGTIATGTWSATAIATTKGGTGLTSYTTGDVIYASATNTLAKLAAGTEGYLLTMSSGVPVWAAAPVSLPSQSGYNGYYLTTNGTSASWGALPISQPSNTTISGNTATTVDTTALSAFTSIEYMVSLKQGSKIRTSKVILQTDGTSVDMTEFGITETGGTMTGVVVSATTSGSNALLQATVTDASSTNVTAKLTKIKL